jgi:hypothetical protein
MLGRQGNPPAERPQKRWSEAPPSGREEMMLCNVTNKNGMTILVMLNCWPDMVDDLRRGPATDDDDNDESAQPIDSETWAHWGM